MIHQFGDTSNQFELTTTPPMTDTVTCYPVPAPAPQPCPACGHCPTCGRGAAPLLPAPPWPHYPSITWAVGTYLNT